MLKFFASTFIAPLMNCAMVWHLKNGEWKAVFHSDMKAEK